MYCVNCGKKLSSEVKFCSSCGASVIDGDQQVPGLSLIEESCEKELVIKEGLCNRIINPAYVQNGHATLTNNSFVYSQNSLVRKAAASVFSAPKSNHEIEIPIEEIKMIGEGRQGVSKTIVIHTINGERYDFYFTERKLWLVELNKLVNMNNNTEKTVSLENISASNEIKGQHLNEKNPQKDETANNNVMANAASLAPSDKKIALKALEHLTGYFSVKENDYNSRNIIIHRLNTIRKPSFTRWLIGGGVASFVLVISIDMVFSLDVGWWGLILIWGLITIWGYKRSKELYVDEINKLNEKLVIIETELIEYYNKASDCIIAFEYSEPQIIKKIVELLSQGRADTVKEGINIMLDDLHKEAMYIQQVEIAKNSKDAASSSSTTNLLIGASILSKRK